MSNQSRVIDTRRVAERSMTHSIADDLFDFIAAVALFGQCGRHRSVDDLEVATPRKFLELHQSEIWFDPCGVAIHDQTNRAGWGNHRGLRVAIAVFLAQGDGCIPALFG